MPQLAAISVAVLASAVAAIIAALQVYRRGKAERELVALLRDELAKDGSIVDSMTKTNPRGPNTAVVRRAGKIIESAAASMKNESDRELVLRGLKQRSDTGRVDYIRKVVGESVADQGGSPAGCN
jgi:hypothetical protein